METTWTEWTRRLRFRHLKLLLTLHETRNLSQTAERSAMTQPALSKWLRELESDLGAVLFERHSRGVVPTAQCEYLVARARLVLNELDRTAEQLLLMGDGSAGKLYVGTTPVAMGDTVPAAAAQFCLQYPRATISVMDGYLDQMIPLLREGRLDLIVSLLEDRDYGGGLAQERLYAQRFVVIGARRHPLARRRTVAWEDALGYPWIGPPANSPLRRELEQELALAHQPLPRFAVEVSSTMLLSAIVERTQMLSLVASETAAYHRAAGHASIIPVAIRRSSYVGIMWRKDRPLGPLDTAFVQALRGLCAGREGAAPRRRSHRRG